MQSDHGREIKGFSTCERTGLTGKIDYLLSFSFRIFLMGVHDHVEAIT